MSGIEQRIECHVSGKLLARVTGDGIKFWCEKHRKEELYTWQQIETWRRQLQSFPVELIQTGTPLAH